MVRITPYTEEHISRCDHAIHKTKEILKENRNLSSKIISRIKKKKTFEFLKLLQNVVNVTSRHIFMQLEVLLFDTGQESNVLDIIER
jgi:hypothetical protein